MWTGLRVQAVVALLVSWLCIFGPSLVLAAPPESDHYRVERWKPTDESGARPIFRIRGGCRMSSGKIHVLHMGREARYLLDQAVANRELHSVDTLPTHLPTIDGDLLVGAKPKELPRESSKEFVKDITPFAVALDVILGDSLRSVYTEYECWGNYCDGAAKEPLQPIMSLPRAVVEMVESRVNHTIVGTLIAALGSKTTFVPVDRFDQLNEEGVCFKSVIVFSAQFPNEFEDAFTSEHFVWRELGLRREPKPLDERVRDGRCNVRVEAVSRKKTSSLSNVYHLNERVQELAKDLKKTDIDVSVSYYENRRALYQVYRAYMADILVSPFHTVEANMFFMRKGSAVIEVFPVGSSQAHFDGLAKFLGLSFEAFAALPSPDAFKFCLENEVKSKSAEGITWYDTLITKLATNTSEKATSSPMSQASACVQKFDNTLDMDLVAGAIVRHAKRLCNL